MCYAFHLLLYNITRFYVCAHVSSSVFLSAYISYKKYILKNHTINMCSLCFFTFPIQFRHQRNTFSTCSNDAFSCQDVWFSMFVGKPNWNYVVCIEIWQTQYGKCNTFATSNWCKWNESGLGRIVGSPLKIFWWLLVSFSELNHCINQD